MPSSRTKHGRPYLHTHIALSMLCHNHAMPKQIATKHVAIQLRFTKTHGAFPIFCSRPMHGSNDNRFSALRSSIQQTKAQGAVTSALCKRLWARYVFVSLTLSLSVITAETSGDRAQTPSASRSLPGAWPNDASRHVPIQDLVSG
jgi:hypothetical protein